MLSYDHRLRNADIARLFGRPQTQKIVAYPFVFFVGKQRNPANNQRGIQISNKFSKSAVKRHILKRAFYDEVQKYLPQHGYYILAVPQKKRQEEMTQVLATADKTTILTAIKKQYVNSLSSLTKKLGSSAELKKL